MKSKRLVPSHLHELHESNFSFVSRIKFIRSKLSNFSASVSRVTVSLFPAAELTETKPPPAAQSFTADSLSQNTLWLRDELFSKNVYATAERDHKDDRHVYVNGLSDLTVGGPTVGLYASARVVGSSLGSVEDSGSPRPALRRSPGSARMARRLHSLGIQVRSNPVSQTNGG